MALRKIIWTAAFVGAGICFQRGALPAPPETALNSSHPLSVQAGGLENLFQLSDRIYSGAAPDGERGFASLKRLGIKTIISVDGTRPDVELAHKYGLRYLHMPHGYDGISTNIQFALIKFAQTAPAPIFVHCHHGTHRGPTAAAVICMGTEGWTPAQGEAWLKIAGTSTNYPGLFQTVLRFHGPSATDIKNTGADFPEVAKLPDLVNLMIGIDEHWDRLKTFRKKDYHSRTSDPDIEPENESVILWEHFREAQRMSESISRGKEFLGRLRSIELELREASDLLQKFAAKPAPEIPTEIDRHFDAAGMACISCHKEFRDKPRGN